MASVGSCHEVGWGNERRDYREVDWFLVAIADLHRAERLVVVEPLAAEGARVISRMKCTRFGAHEGRRVCALVDACGLRDGVLLRGLDRAGRGALGRCSGCSVVVVSLVVVPMKGRAVGADGDVVRQRVYSRGLNVAARELPKAEVFALVQPDGHLSHLYDVPQHRTNQREPLAHVER